MTHLYDAIGGTYREYRRPDARIAGAITRALGDARTAVNVGAGAGAYEPRDRSVVAVEPSLTMIRQRPEGSAPVVQASARQLPFRDGTFAAALAVLTVHHWPERAQSLTELARVAHDRVVVVTWDPSSVAFWLTDEYFPEIVAIDRRIFPTMEELRQTLGRVEVQRLPIPHDCSDGFSRSVLAPAPGVSRRGRSERHLDVHEASRQRAWPGPSAEGHRGRHLGATLRAHPERGRARPRLSHRHRQRRARVTGQPAPWPRWAR